MLREDKRARYVREGAWFWTRHRFTAGKLTAKAVKPQQLVAAEQAQLAHPVAVMHGNGRRWWWFHDRFYWDDDDLSAGDVMALVIERERKKERQLSRAHAAMHQEQSGVPRREPIPREVRRAVWERDGGKCAECQATFDLQYDHLIPFSMGGATTAQNPQLLCADCNRAKGASL